MATKERGEPKLPGKSGMGGMKTGAPAIKISGDKVASKPPKVGEGCGSGSHDSKTREHGSE